MMGNKHDEGTEEELEIIDINTIISLQEVLNVWKQGCCINIYKYKMKARICQGFLSER
jgi:hypothetical protein